MDEAFLREDVLDEAYKMTDFNVATARSRWLIINAVRQEQRRQWWAPAFLSFEDFSYETGISRSTLSTLLGDDDRPVAEIDKKRGQMWRIDWIFQRLPPPANKRAAGLDINHPAWWRNWPWRVTDQRARAARLGITLDALIRATETDSVARSQPQIRDSRGTVARSKGRIARPFFFGLDRIADLGEASRDQPTLGRANQGGNRATRSNRDGDSSSPRDDDQKPSASPEEQKQKNGEVVLDGMLVEAYGVVRGAIWRRTETDVDDGTTLEKQLRRIVTRVPIETLLRGVETAPAGHKAYLVVQHLQKIADGRTELLGQDPPPEPAEPRAAEQDIAYLVTLEREGVELDDMQRQRLAAWQTRDVQDDEERA